MLKTQSLAFDDTRIAFEAKNDKQLKKTYFIFSLMNRPWLVNIGTSLAGLSLKMKLPVKGLIRRTVFDQFCGGESIANCASTIQHLGDYHVHTILDYSVEGQQDEATFDYTTEESLRVADFAAQNTNIPFCVVKLSGLGSVALMEKIQAGKKLSSEEAAAFDRIKLRADKIAARAAVHNLKFMIDAEETWIQDVIDRICLDLMLKYNKHRPVVYNTYQLYRHQALPNMKAHFEEVRSKGCFFAAKLVRGAYMEKERERAQKMGYNDPIQVDKAATDRDYDLAQKFVIDHIDYFSVCSGTHNENSCRTMAEWMEEKGIAPKDERIYFAQLLGMSDNISFVMAKAGYNVAKYVPYGPVEKVMPYLIRRAEENTSIAGQSSREYLLVKRERARRKI